MTVLLCLAGIVAVLALCSWLLRFELDRQHKAMRTHATREHIRQSQQMHPWDRGELPEAAPSVDRALARRIAYRKAKPGDVLRFHAGGQ